MVSNTESTKKIVRQVSDSLRVAALRAAGLNDKFGAVHSQLQILFRMVIDLKNRVDEMEKNRDNSSVEER